MKMAQTLPASVFGVWHHIPKVVSAGGAAFGKISKLLPSSSGLSSAGTPSEERNRQTLESEYGLSLELQKELEPQTMKTILSENTVGADSEALICLKKGPAGLWGECDDYALYVKKLAELERGRRPEDGGGDRRKLRVTAYFAETDAMIGKKGQSYVEECWKGSGENEFQDVLEFTTTTIKETDHDSVVQTVEVLKQIFLDAGGVAPAGL